jgi:hypothetical protein
MLIVVMLALCMNQVDSCVQTAVKGLGVSLLRRSWTSVDVFHVFRLLQTGTSFDMRFTENFELTVPTDRHSVASDSARAQPTPSRHGVRLVVIQILVQLHIPLTTSLTSLVDFVTELDEPQNSEVKNSAGMSVQWARSKIGVYDMLDVSTAHRSIWKRFHRLERCLFRMLIKEWQTLCVFVWNVVQTHQGKTSSMYMSNSAMLSRYCNTVDVDLVEWTRSSTFTTVTLRVPLTWRNMYKHTKRDQQVYVLLPWDMGVDAYLHVQSKHLMEYESQFGAYLRTGCFSLILDHWRQRLQKRFVHSAVQGIWSMIAQVLTEAIIWSHVLTDSSVVHVQDGAKPLSVFDKSNEECDQLHVPMWLRHDPSVQSLFTGLTCTHTSFAEMLGAVQRDMQYLLSGLMDGGDLLVLNQRSQSIRHVYMETSAMIHTEWTAVDVNVLLTACIDKQDKELDDNYHRVLPVVQSGNMTHGIDPSDMANAIDSDTEDDGDQTPDEQSSGEPYRDTAFGQRKSSEVIPNDGLNDLNGVITNDAESLLHQFAVVAVDAFQKYRIHMWQTRRNRYTFYRVTYTFCECEHALHVAPCTQCMCQA